jgi:hypothetical protein
MLGTAGGNNSPVRPFASDPVKAAAATVASKIAAAMKGSAGADGEIVPIHPERA